MTSNRAEREPLIAKPLENAGSCSIEREDARHDTPLPMGQLAVLSLVRVAEPINFTMIFPFVNQMMLELKVTDQPSEIGFYSGLVDSMFSIAQCFTILQWGRLSDRLGRRPTILLGLLGPGLSIFLFGMSWNLAWALTSRCIAGATAGNIAVIQSILAEITDSTNEAKAMPLTSIFWSVGSIIGPIIGGTLSHPAEQWPSSPFNNSWFCNYPYALPCSIGALITFVAFLVAYIWLEETLDRQKHALFEPSKVAAPTVPCIPTPPHLTANESQQPKAKLTTIRDILSHPPIRLVIVSGFLISALATSYDVVFALMCFTPIRLGGLSLTTAQIGYFLAFGGVFSIVILPKGLPVMQRYFGTTRLYNIICVFWPIIDLAFPFLNLLARYLAIEEPGISASITGGSYLLWIGIGAIVILSRVANMLFALSTMLVKAAAPDRAMLGSTYGVTLTIACMARAIFPIFVSTLFALSVDKQLLQGHLVWYVMAAIGVGGVVASNRLKALGV